MGDAQSGPARRQRRATLAGGGGHAMARAAGSSRPTFGNGTRTDNGTNSGSRADAGSGTGRYTDADLEPIRAALAAFARGDLRPRARRAGDRQNGAMLAEIGQLADEIGGQLASLNSEVTQKEAQVRDIALITTAVARGDLTGKVTVDALGEMLQLKQTVNTMVDQLSAFADEVTRVAREVGTEGRLGGQAYVRGVSGVWKDLTDNVNFMAGNLTGQVRNIAQVTTAVANGDLSKKIDVDARGEILELKTTINTMVDQLSAFASEVTRVAREVGTEGRLGGQAQVRGVSGVWKDLTDNVNGMASNLTGQVRNIAQVTTAVANGDLSKKIDVDARGEILELKTTINTMVDQLSAFASEVTRVELGEGLAGQAAVERSPILITDAPAGYLKVGSGLGEAAPVSVAVLPILFEDQVLGVLELASLTRFSDVHLAFFDQFVGTIGVAINTIMANSRTEALLSESQRLTSQLQERSVELQRQQAELRRSNAELEDKAALLATQNSAIEIQNRQIEQARSTLEERAQQLAISSRYKSDFLANMSHELRTPLNSLLVLAKLLSENQDGNLTGQQVEFARTIHAAGSDLLQLINDILDLSKVEAGKMDVNPAELPLAALVEYVDATFHPMAEDKGLSFSIDVRPGTPDQLYVDEQRLEQIVRNLLSNAVKFTSAGEVRLTVGRAGRVEFGGALRGASDVIEFAVSDTGVGIAKQKLGTIFDAFSQADGTTSRRYGGTGLGLSISRDIARLLGGEIRASSRPGKGSTFTLYLPAGGPVNGSHPPARAAAARAAAAERTATADAAEALPPAGDGDDALSGARILIVDDDARSVFALTGVFERYGAEVLYAENGRAGIESLERNEDISLVLMDVMMPELDGNATMRAIRRMPQFTELPIIALTAKAMKGDREKSIMAGASDYVPKPVETDHLLHLMRSWLQRSAGPRTEGRLANSP